MATPFIGEIKMFSGNYAPNGWSLCNGQLLAINQNQALFSLLGTTYGGNGIETFALPNLQCCVAIHQGQGPGLSPYSMGQITGAATTTLTSNNLPLHSHSLSGSSAAGTTRIPGPSLALANVGHNHNIYDNSGSAVELATGSIGVSGSGTPISNLQPYLVITFIIALEGIFPSRN
jgi:microcystin-dependent protein